MKLKTSHIQVIDNQSGIALVSALLLLLVVSMMAVAVSMDTSMDIRIAGYQRFKARSFAFSESGAMTGFDILENNIFSAGDWDASSGDIAYPEKSDLYSGGITVKQGHGAFYMDENPNNDTVLEMDGDIEADMTFQRVLAKKNLGAAIQMAAGYSGLGKGAGGGGVMVVYNAEAMGGEEAKTRLGVHIRHITN